MGEDGQPEPARHPQGGRGQGRRSLVRLPRVRLPERAGGGHQGRWRPDHQDEEGWRRTQSISFKIPLNVRTLMKPSPSASNNLKAIFNSSKVSSPIKASSSPPVGYSPPLPAGAGGASTMVAIIRCHWM